MNAQTAMAGCYQQTTKSTQATNQQQQIQPSKPAWIKQHHPCSSEAPADRGPVANISLLVECSDVGDDQSRHYWGSVTPQALDKSADFGENVDGFSTREILDQPASLPLCIPPKRISPSNQSRPDRSTRGTNVERTRLTTDSDAVGRRWYRSPCALSR